MALSSNLMPTKKKNQNGLSDALMPGNPTHETYGYTSDSPFYNPNLKLVTSLPSDNEKFNSDGSLIVNKNLAPVAKTNGSNGFGSLGDIGNSLKTAGLSFLGSLSKISANAGMEKNMPTTSLQKIDGKYQIVKGKTQGQQDLANANTLNTMAQQNATDTSNMNPGGKILNFIAKQAPSFAAYSLIPGGAEEGIASRVGTAVTDKLAPKIGTFASDLIGKSASGAVGMGGFSGITTGLEGGNAKDIANSTLQGAKTGLEFGAGGKILGSVLSKLKPTESLSTELKPTNTNTPIAETNSTTEAIQPRTMQQGQTFNLTQNKMETPVSDALRSTTDNLKSNTNIDSSVIKPSQSLNTDFSKINDETTLSDHVNVLQNAVDEAKKNPLAMNLKLFSQKLEEAQNRLGEIKQSKFRTNTIENTTALNSAEKAQINPSEFDYVTQSSKDWQDNAEKAVNQNINQVMNKLENQKSLSGGQDAHEAAVVAMKLKEQAQTTGNYQPLVSWLKTVSSKTRETARALKGTDTAWEKKTSDGAIMDTARAVDNAEEAIKKTNPKKIEDINNQAKDTTDKINKAQQEASKQAIKEILPEELLANKVSNTLKENVPPKTNPVTDMVNELFKSAKESPLPEKIQAAARNPVDYLKQAIQNKGQYTDVWEKAKTILKDKYKDSPEASATLDDYFNKGIVPTYSENTLNRSVQTSMKELQQKLVDIAKSNQGNKQKSLSDLTEYLTKNTNATGDDAQLLASKVHDRFTQLVNEKSDSILTNMFKDKPKAQQKNLVEKVQELINLGAYDKQSIRDLIKQKEGLPVLESKDIKFITEHMDKAKTFKEGTYNNKKELALVREVIENKTPKTTFGKINSIQTMGMLSAPKTAIRNTVSNALFRGVTNLKDTVRTGIDIPLSKLTGERTSTLSDLNAQGKGFKTGAKETLLDFKNNVNTKGTDKMELTNNQWDKNGNLLNRTMSNVGRYERMMLSDRPFEGATFADEMARQKKLAEINKTPFDEAKAVEKAKHEAAYTTFQDDTYLSNLALNMKKFLNGGKEWGAGDVFLKFAKTPANITSRAIDYTPLVAFGKALGAAVNKQGFNQETFVNELAKGITGTGVIALGAALNKMGVISSSKTENSNLNALNTKAGLGNFTLNLSALNRFTRGGSATTQKGDSIVSYDWASPTSVLLTLGSELGKSNSKDLFGKSGDVLESLLTGINGLIDQPMTQGLQTLFGSHNFAKAGTNLIASIPQTFIPSIVNNLRQFDNQQKETYDPNIFKQGLNQAINRVPIANKLLPNKKDIMGEDKKVMQNNSLSNIFLNPATSTKYNPDASTENALNLYNSTGTSSLLPKLVDKTVNGIKLTPKQYTDYQQDLGSRISDIYSSNPSEKEANKLVLKASKAAKDTLLSKIGQIK